MTIRQQINGLLDILPENKIAQIYDYVRFLTQEQIYSDTPNAETLAAFKEGDGLINDKSAPQFSTVEALFEDLMN